MHYLFRIFAESFTFSLDPLVCIEWLEGRAVSIIRLAGVVFQCSDVYFSLPLYRSCSFILCLFRLQDAQKSLEILETEILCKSIIDQYLKHH